MPTRSPSCIVSSGRLGVRVRGEACGVRRPGLCVWAPTHQQREDQEAHGGEPLPDHGSVEQRVPVYVCVCVSTIQTMYGSKALYLAPCPQCAQSTKMYLYDDYPIMCTQVQRPTHVISSPTSRILRPRCAVDQISPTDAGARSTGSCRTRLSESG